MSVLTPNCAACGHPIAAHHLVALAIPGNRSDAQPMGGVRICPVNVFQIELLPPALADDQIEPIVFDQTSRGFKRGEFKDQYGHACSIQESSLATDACIWLGVNDPNPQQFPGDNTGWHPYPLPANVECTTRMHLSRSQVAALLPLLQRFLETGQL